MKFREDKWETSDGLGNPKVTNGDRARWAEAAVEEFKKQCHIEDEGILHEHIGDLLADLMHLCNREAIDFHAALADGQEHHRREK